MHAWAWQSCVRLLAWITEDDASQGLAQQPLLTLEFPSGVLILSARVHGIAECLPASSHHGSMQDTAMRNDDDGAKHVLPLSKFTSHAYKKNAPTFNTESYLLCAPFHSTLYLCRLYRPMECLDCAESGPM